MVRPPSASTSPRRKRPGPLPKPIAPFGLTWSAPRPVSRPRAPARPRQAARLHARRPAPGLGRRTQRRARRRSHPGAAVRRPRLPADRDQSRGAGHTALGYFEANAPRMRYKHFRSCGLFVGSGAVEAGCKAVPGSGSSSPACTSPSPARPASSPCAASKPAAAGNRSGSSRPTSPELPDPASDNGPHSDHPGQHRLPASHLQICPTPRRAGPARSSCWATSGLCARTFLPLAAAFARSRAGGDEGERAAGHEEILVRLVGKHEAGCSPAMIPVVRATGLGKLDLDGPTPARHTGCLSAGMHDRRVLTGGPAGQD
jgi:hypothetical protein